jgi:hypothetical protein
VSLLWPSRLAGLLDGAPLDTRADALVIGLALPAMWIISPRVVRLRATRALIVGLLVWKGLLALVAVPDGWCVRFTSPVPLFVNDVRVPHALFGPDDASVPLDLRVPGVVLQPAAGDAAAACLR